MCPNKKCSYVEEIEKKGVCPLCGTKAGEYTSWLGEVSYLKRRKASFHGSLKQKSAEEKRAEEISKREEELKRREQEITDREHEVSRLEREVSSREDEPSRRSQRSILSKMLFVVVLIIVVSLTVVVLKIRP